jgi:integrase
VGKIDVAAAIRAGGNKRHSIGNGLSLYIRGKSALSTFQFRDRASKKTRAVSLGSARTMSLTQARDARIRYQASLIDGTAPGPGKAVGKTFGEALQSYLDTHGPAWKGGLKGIEARAHRRLFRLVLAKVPLSRIDTSAVRTALAPWDGRPTSGKIRIKIKSVLDFATASGWYHGANPADAKTVGKLLPAIAKATHFEAMPWADVPSFMATLAGSDAPASRALRFTILTAARTGETLGATWSEIQGDDVWAIGTRMKEGIPHSVPLTAAALAVLPPRGGSSELIFGELYNDAMRIYVRDYGVSVHGFRSTFVDWAAEHGYSSELRETALAHAVGGTVQRAYMRTKLLEERRPMMEAWANFISTGQP